MTTIYYFSGTGNSLYAARALQKKLGGAELVAIASLAMQGTHRIEAERALFVFPIYYLSFPKLVLDFLESASFREGGRIICVATRGFKPMGGAIAHFRELLRKKGTDLHVGLYINMPSNDVTLFNLQLPEVQRQILSTVDAQLDRAASRIESGKRWFQIEPFAFVRRFRHKSAYLDSLCGPSPFHAESTCSGCGLCQRVCPVGNIVMKSGGPAWKAQCQLCEACINFCPRQAIQYRGRSQKKGRYTHPQITWADIGGQRGGLEPELTTASR